MPARATWKGSLKLSLITIPIRVFPATNPGSDVSFRQFHRKCHTPIKLKKWCPHCDEEVQPEDIVKGYESEKGRFVMVEEEEIARLRPESTHTVDITHVTDASAIDPIYVERAYFIAPDNKAAGSAFAVLREALDHKAGVGRLAIHGREYLVAVLPRDRALLLYTLRTAGEVNDSAAIDELRLGAVRTRPEEVKLARQILGGFESVSDLSVFTDRYQESLRAMLKAARDREAATTARAGKAAAPVNLMDALRRSLAHVPAQKKRPARAAGGRRRARVLPYPSQRKSRRAS
jgi:DNA end-binding protein Ku